ncbi:TolC family protein, partial [Pontiella sp.]
MTNHKAMVYGLVLGTTALGLSSCTTLEPDREADLLKEQTPERFANASGSAAMQTRWWKAFDSAQLDRLMDEAFAGNLSLEQAFARMEQAAATARKSGAAGKFQLDAQASSSSKHFAYADADHTTTPASTLGLYASYEVDLWGRLKSAERASLAAFEATKFDLQTAGMSLSAALATSYFSWQAQSEALRIYESQLESNRNKLAALERRYQSGQSTSLAVLQQRQQVAASEAR